MSNEAFAYAKAQLIKSSPQKLLYLLLAERINNETGTCFPGQELLAEEATMCRRAVVTHLAALEVAGYITRRKRFRFDGAPTSDEFTLPGFLEWLKNTKEDARTFHERYTTTGGNLHTVGEESTMCGNLPPNPKKNPKRNPHLGGESLEQPNVDQTFADSTKVDIKGIKSQQQLQVERGGARNHKVHRLGNTRKAYPERFEAFWNEYKAAANGMHGAKDEALGEYDRLSKEDQDAALAAIPAHRAKLGDIKFKYACRYLHFRQFDEYADEARAASAPPSDRAIVAAIVSDLMDMAPSRIKAHGWASFGAVKQERPDLFHSAVQTAKTECFWTPRGELVALAA
jgi:hypothetical protein